jgi:hypothetical protein
MIRSVLDDASRRAERQGIVGRNAAALAVPPKCPTSARTLVIDQRSIKRTGA